MSRPSKPGTVAPPPAALAVLAAFAAVYFIWGSTFLAMRYAVETLPPFLMVAARCLVSGGILYGWLRLRGVPAPRREHWLSAAVVGPLLFVGGQAMVAWAQRRVPSGLAAVLLATSPLWMVLLAGRQRRSGRAHWSVLAGLGLGLAGVAILVGPASLLRGGGIDSAGAAALLAAALSWSAGSIHSRARAWPASQPMAASAQLVAGGAALGLLSLLAGELSSLDPRALSMRSLAALAYLIVFGSLITFSAYHWLLGVASAARVATYAYVNPVVAVWLGWAVAGEPITARLLAATIAIVGGVALITTFHGRATRPALESVGADAPQERGPGGVAPCACGAGVHAPPERPWTALPWREIVARARRGRR